MFCQMKGDAYRLTIDSTKHNLNIYLTALDIFTEYPHLSQMVQCIYNGPLNIVLYAEAFNHDLSV